jgi:N utilization substance protein A
LKADLLEGVRRRLLSTFAFSPELSDPMSVKLETQSIRTIAAFENITEVHAKDCLLTEDCVYFIVDPEKVGLVIGRNGTVIRELRRVFGKSVRVLGYFDSPEAFIRNTFPTVKSIDINGGGITITLPDEDKVAAIGKSGRNIKAVREIMDRHFSVKSLRVK